MTYVRKQQAPVATPPDPGLEMRRAVHDWKNNSALIQIVSSLCDEREDFRRRGCLRQAKREMEKPPRTSREVIEMASSRQGRMDHLYQERAGQIFQDWEALRNRMAAKLGRMPVRSDADWIIQDSGRLMILYQAGLFPSFLQYPRFPQVARSGASS